MGVRPDARDERLEAVERRFEPLLERYVVFVGLAIGLAPTPAVVREGPAYWLLIGAVSAGVAGWSLFFVPRLQVAPLARPVAGAGYIAGLVAATWALTYLSPFFAFLGLAVYVHGCTFLPARWWPVPMVFGSVAVAYAQVGGRFATFTPGLVIGFGVLVLINAGAAAGFTYYGTYVTDRSTRRKRMIDELAALNTRLSETLAENAGLHAQLLLQAREAGVLDERTRMAGEIHDTLAQGLTGIVAQLEAAASADGEAKARHLDVAGALARESLTEARRSVAALGPGPLATAQLPVAVREMAENWAATAGVAVTVEITGSAVPLLPEIEVTLFRVAQEALANVGKHAGAGRAALTLSYMDDVVVLDVRDDGSGFATDAPRDGYGLTAMELRVHRVAGRLAVESAPGEGTAISASVPALPEIAGEKGDR